MPSSARPRTRVVRPPAPPRAPATRRLWLVAANDNRPPLSGRLAALLTAAIAAAALAAAFAYLDG